MLRDAPRLIERLYVAREGVAGAGDAAADARKAGLEVRTCDSATLNEVTAGGRHQGVAARMAPFPYVDLAEIVDRGCELLLALDCIQDPRNLGAILRTAAAVQVGGVLLPRDRSVGMTGAALRSAGGYGHRLPIARVTNLARTIEELTDQGWRAVGLAPDASRSVYHADLTGRVLLVVGGEGKGVRPLVAARCDEMVALPMGAGVESLNAAVAASVTLYEINRQRTRERG
jgi:23S rRNA (guanosine2251-2'-O)-methyltransferase